MFIVRAQELGRDTTQVFIKGEPTKESHKSKGQPAEDHRSMNLSIVFLIFIGDAKLLKILVRHGY